MAAKVFLTLLLLSVLVAYCTSAPEPVADPAPHHHHRPVVIVRRPVYILPGRRRYGYNY